MTPYFVISYPRSRTVWLAIYLKGLGIPAVHEAYKYAAQGQPMQEFLRGLSKDGGPVVNVDCGNTLCLDNIKRDFPDARYIVITRDIEPVMDELKAVFGHWMEEIREPLREMFRLGVAQAHAHEHFDIEFDKWTPDVSQGLVDWMGGPWPLDSVWHYFMHGVNAQLLPERMKQEFRIVSNRQFVETR